MPIAPVGSSVVINGNTLFVSDVKVSFITEFFDRLEFQHARLNSAPNSVGQHALKTTLLGDTRAQIVIGALSFTPVVPQNPDVLVSGSNFGNVKKKFNILRYELSGAPSDSGSVSNVLTTAKNHIQQLAVFQAYLDKASNMDTEYNELIALQSETFSYLTNTGISMSGNSLNGTVDNILITSFSPDVVYEYPTDLVGGYQLFQTWTATIDVRTITDKDVVV